MDSKPVYYKEGIVTMLPPRGMFDEEDRITVGPRHSSVNLAGLFTIHVTWERDEILEQKYK